MIEIASAHPHVSKQLLFLLQMSPLKKKKSKDKATVFGEFYGIAAAGCWFHQPRDSGMVGVAATGTC